MTSSTPIRPISAVCAVLATGVLVTACSSTDGQGSLFRPTTGGSGASSGSPTGFPTGGASSGGPATSLTPSGTPVTGAQDPTLATQLLTPTELPGFSVVPSTSAPDPLPCTPSEPPLFIANVPDQRADVRLLSSTDQARAGETIAYYSDSTRADAAIAAAKRGFDCSNGQLGSTSVRIVKVADSSGTTSAGAVVRISRWDFASPGGGLLGTAIVAVSRGTVAALSLTATAQGKNEINVQTVVKAALDKVQIR